MVTERSEADALRVSPVRKLLFAVFMLSLMSSAMGGGTFASFSATTTSGSSTFATGTLVLDFNRAGTACLSSGNTTTIGDNDVLDGVGEGANANEATCAATFTGLTGLKPGASSASTVDLTLENAGTLTASAMDFFWSGAACADSSAGGTYVGNGNLCDAVEVTVTEYSDPGRTAATYCWFGSNAGAAAACTPGNTAQLGHLSAKDAAGAGTAIARWTTDLTTGTKKYLRIGIQLPDTGLNQNALQGRTVSFALQATLTQ